MAHPSSPTAPVREERIEHHHHSHRTRVNTPPSALPGSIVPSAGTPVEGVAIVGCKLNRTAEEREAELNNVLDMLDILEPVMPLRPAPSLDDLYMSSECDSNPSVRSLRGESPTSPNCGVRPFPRRNPAAAASLSEVNKPHETFTSGGQGSVRTSADSQWPSEDKPCSRSLLNKGYVLFADDFVSSLKNSFLKVLTDQYRESVATREPALHVDPHQTERQQRIVEACYYLSLAESESRPLFRRRASELVYGRATYEGARSV